MEFDSGQSPSRTRKQTNSVCVQVQGQEKGKATDKVNNYGSVLEEENV